MSKSELKISIDKPDRIYRGGETVTGAVEVYVNERCECKALILKCEWRTHGKGNIARGEVTSVNLFSGTWEPGASFAYEFSIQLPAGPATYHGTYLNVDWYLKAQADVPWAIDPKSEADFVLIPISARVPAKRVSEIKKPSGACGMGCMLVMSLIFGGVGVGLLVASLQQSGCATLMMAGFGALFAAAGVWILVSSIRKTIAEKRLGPLHLELSGDRARGGDPLTATVRFTPSADIALSRVMATLQAFERCVSGSGTNTTTHRHTFFTRDVQLCGPRGAAAGAGVELRGEFVLPADAPPSFNASDNELTWSVKFVVSMEGLPDVSRDVTFTVAS